jgi:hypothetical protein
VIGDVFLADGHCRQTASPVRIETGVAAEMEMSIARGALQDDRPSGADTLMTAVIHGIVDADLGVLPHFVVSQ